MKQSRWKQAAQTNIKRHGDDFFQKIGSKGGSTTTKKPKGFAALSKKQRAEVSRKAAQARWQKEK